MQTNNGTTVVKVTTGKRGDPGPARYIQVLHVPTRKEQVAVMVHDYFVALQRRVAAFTAVCRAFTRPQRPSRFDRCGLVEPSDSFSSFREGMADALLMAPMSRGRRSVEIIRRSRQVRI